MDAKPSPGQSPHDVETCGCDSCQLFRYQRQYGPAPGPGKVPPPPPGPPPGYGPQQAAVANERTLAALAHWSPLVVAFLFALFLPLPFPALFCFIPPLVLMLTARTDFLRDQSCESLNFQLTVLIPSILFGLIPGIGFVLALLLFVGCLILQILAAVAASRGEWHRYPVCVRLVKPGPAQG
ncbi:DUF4870 domain-containing protein [Streptomyces sp. NPDC051569]|uniref:DUF4870 domain-containing protein n=1 Tax=Streptomyces sp. NPDC051569 TaxID=3365661 RepID=UPI003797A246